MRIRWTDPAVYDFTQICDYVGEHGSAAIAAVSHCRFTSRQERSPDFLSLVVTGRKPETRELAFPGLPYVAIYRIREECVEII